MEVKYDDTLLPLPLVLLLPLAYACLTRLVQAEATMSRTSRSKVVVRQA